MLGLNPGDTACVVNTIMHFSFMSVQVDPKELKPHPKNAEIYDDRLDQDFEDSISENGILEPLVVNSQNVILSGVRRWRAALKLGMDKVPCRIEDPEDEVKAILEYNRYRQKTPREFYNEYRLIKEREALKAEERMFSGTSVPNLEQGRVLKQAAKELEVSSGKLHQIDFIYRHEGQAEDIVKRLNREEIPVYKAYEEVKKRIETPKTEGEKEPKTWKCGACLQEFEVEEPVNLTICPYCEMEFINWKAEKGLGDSGKQG